MMDRMERDALRAEVVQLRQFLDRLPEDDWMTRPSFEVRLERVEAELAAAGDDVGIVQAWLDFDGEPVRQARGGLSLPFVGPALYRFQRALEFVGASCMGGLAASGPPADRDDYALALMDTTPGSFRFKLEGPSAQGSFAGIESPLAIAVARFKGLLESSIADEQLYVNDVSDLDERALNAVGDFLKAVASAGAVCGFEYRGEQFRYRMVDDVALASERMGPESISDVNAEVVGHIMGYLPDSRRVEVRVLDPGLGVSLRSGGVMRAAVAAGLDDAFRFNRHLGVDVSVALSVRNFAGRRVSYRVTGCRLLPDGGDADGAGQ